ncbi:MAG: hypothetical protein E6Q69_04995 [Aquipseudomonas alcaligenes]|uniref:Uncharacterized protein n=1 Tax=Aquipseudomonas alcaligenes TaxID=43263 RepID=A0A5C7WA05_AQUAC|nr:MAG: hypothetical protein E6Q69_04995 [Pseudomonas alcaligenes]
MTNDKGLITYTLATLLVGAICILLGVSIFTGEASIVRWTGVLVGFVGFVLILRAWIVGSVLHFEARNREAWWSIKRALRHYN